MYRNTMTRYLRRKGKEITLELIECCRDCCKPDILNTRFDKIFYILNHTDKIDIEERYPTSGFLYENLWGYRYDKDENYKKCLKELSEDIASSFTESSFSIKEENVDPEYVVEVADVCYNYFAWLSSKLGENMVIEKEETISTLKQILDIFEKD